MREMTKTELRDCQISILNYFKNLCKNNNLQYWLEYGTLLGAVRHKGYIPWDDDIDVAMFRKDYDKLIDVCRINPDIRYKFSCVENDPSCMYPFGKIIDTQTVLYELGEDGIKTGVYIDIFVYDDAPENENERNKIFDKLDFYGRLRDYQLPMGKAPLSLKRVLVIIARKVISFFPRQYFTKKIIENAKNNCKTESGYVCDFTFPYYCSRWCVKKAIFEELIELEFEKQNYKAPKRFDEWLKIQYGDYMKLPSIEEQQAAQHKIKAYFKE